TQLVQGPEGGGDGFWQRYIMQYLENPSSWGYIVLYFALIIFFSYFYVAIQFDPAEQAENMKKYGGFLPGLRAGGPTGECLGSVPAGPPSMTCATCPTATRSSVRCTSA